jgi:TolB-like protein
MSARLVDAKTGDIIWADNAAYESLDVHRAVETIISYFLGSLKPYWQFE